jgi:hypothetical protein
VHCSPRHSLTQASAAQDFICLSIKLASNELTSKNGKMHYRLRITHDEIPSLNLFSPPFVSLAKKARQQHNNTAQPPPKPKEEGAAGQKRPRVLTEPEMSAMSMLAAAAEEVSLQQVVPEVGM